MNLNKNIKSDALLALKNNWFKSIGITFIWSIVIGIFIFIENFVYLLLNIEHIKLTDIFNKIIFENDFDIFNNSLFSTFINTLLIISLIYLAIFSILKMGDIFWCYLTVHKKENDLTTIFNYFSSLKGMFTSWYISLQISIRKLIWFIIILLPSIITANWSTCATIQQYKIANNVLIPFGYILSIFLAIIALIICSIFFQRYFLARYLIISGECTKVRKAVKLSIKIMNGKKTDCLLLYLSFLGWLVSCIFVIPIFFVLPYIKISLIMYSRYLVEEYKNKINKIETVVSNKEV